MDLPLLPSMLLGRAGIASDMPPAQITTPRPCLYFTRASSITRIISSGRQSQPALVGPPCA